MRPALLCILLVCELATTASAQQLKEITNGIGMKLVLIHAGSFTMGSPESEIGRNDDETPHEVTMSNSYYLGAFEVTQGQYEKVMGEKPTKIKPLKGDPGLYPVTSVKWDDSVLFCRKLSELPNEKAAGRQYRLPTEAEWEYACRATSTTVYCFGDSTESLGEFASYGEEIGRNIAWIENKSRPVGEKKPNRWGLFDMHGNVWEWCQDWRGSNASVEVIDAIGSFVGPHRVLRGGGWESNPESCRSAFRRQVVPTTYGISMGFRVAMSMPAKQLDTSK